MLSLMSMFLITGLVLAPLMTLALVGGLVAATPDLA